MRRTTNAKFVSIPIQGGAEYTLNLANYDPEATKRTKDGLRMRLRNSQIIITTESKERLDAAYASYLQLEETGQTNMRRPMDTGPALLKRNRT